MGLKNPPGIIPAIDMPLGKGIVYIDKLKGLRDEITGLKIGSDIIDNYGYFTTRHLLNEIECEHDIIIDLQKRATDIPNQINKQVRDGAENFGAKAYIGSPAGAGSNAGMIEREYGSFQAFIKACRECDIEPIIVLEMTQPGATYFLREDASEDLARLSKQEGVKYFVAPATRPKRIEIYRKILGEDAEIISPGVGPQKTGDPIKDATNAIKLGADHIVSGRTLINAESPHNMGKRLYEAILEAWIKR